VQSFVTNLAYGSILVVSLLLTLIIPFIQRHLRHFSPLLYFVVLSVVGLGIVLHSSFDRAPAQQAAAQQEAEASAAAPPAEAPADGSAPAAEAVAPAKAVRVPLERIPAEKLYVGPLEVGALGPEDVALRQAAGPWVLAVIVLVLAAVFARVAISQSSRRSVGPAVAVVVAALVLLGAYLMARDHAGPSPPAAEETR
jgi:ribose transport system permease protein